MASAMSTCSVPVIRLLQSLLARRPWERGVTLLAGALMVVPSLVYAALGVAMLVVVAVAHWRRRV